MARAWFQYILCISSEPEIHISSNYVRVGVPFCPKPANNICAIYATVALTQPIITPNIGTYLSSGSVFPYADQPIVGSRKYVLTKGC